MNLLPAKLRIKCFKLLKKAHLVPRIKVTKLTNHSSRRVFSTAGVCVCNKHFCASLPKNIMKEQIWAEGTCLHWSEHLEVFSNFFFISFLLTDFHSHFISALMGSGCSTAVEHTLCDREVVGSYPARCWAFPLLYLISSTSLIQVPHGDATQMIFFKNA